MHDALTHTDAGEADGIFTPFSSYNDLKYMRQERAPTPGDKHACAFNDKLNALYTGACQKAQAPFSQG